MKKIICALMCAVMLLGLTPSVFALKNGDVVDAVLHTDIVTYINTTPIESYNIKGYTAIKVEDLMEYGFVVAWDAGARTLKVTRPVARPVTSNYKPVANTYPVGSYWMDVYYTDIKTYFNGNEVPSYNIGGSTIAYVDDLAKYYTTPDKYIWDGSARTLSLTLPGEVSGSGSGSATAQPAPSSGSGTAQPAPTTPPASTTDPAPTTPTPSVSPIVFTVQPQNQTAAALYTSLPFTVAVTGGTPGYTYTWQTSKDALTWTAFPGGNLQTFALLVDETILNGTMYVRCVVKDSANVEAVSSVAVVTGAGASTGTGTGTGTVAPLTASLSQSAATVTTSTSFSVSCTASGGVAPYKYQWYWAGPDGTYYDMSTYATFNTSSSSISARPDARYSTQYLRCRVTDNIGQYVDSPAFTITVTDVTGSGSSSGGSSSGNISASIPASVSTTVGVGFSGKIVVTVTNGSGDYSYEWHVKKGSDDWFISGDKDNDYNLSASSLNDTSTWMVYCVVTDNKDTSKKISTNTCYVYVSAASSSGGSASSSTPIAAVIKSSADGVASGGSATLTCTASGGSGGYIYTWKTKEESSHMWGIAMNGNGGSTFTLSNIKKTTQVMCTVTDSSGSKVDSNVYTINIMTFGGTITQPITITTPELKFTSHPTSATCTEGGTASFSVSVTGGKSPYTYKWAHVNKYGGVGYPGDGILYSGTQTATLKILNALTADSGDMFYCIVTDANGKTIESGKAVLTVKEAPAPSVTLSYYRYWGGSVYEADLTANVTGGTAPYTYKWEQCSDTEMVWKAIPGSSAASKTCHIGYVMNGWGTYKVTVTDSNGKSGSTTLRISW